MAENLLEFKNLGLLPKTVDLDSLNEGHGVEAALIVHNAGWHRSCRLKYNNTKLERARKHSKDTPADDAAGDSSASVSKRTRRSSSASSSASSHSQDLCFFCEKSAGKEQLHEVSTFKTDKRVRECAALLENDDLRRRLSGGDMVALEAKYHTKCLTNLYYRASMVQREQEGNKNSDNMLCGIAFAELVTYIDESRLKDSTTAPVFKLADLSKLYSSRLDQLGIKQESRVQSTRLKQRILAHFPDMRATKQGRDILLMFDEDIGHALAKVCQQDSDNDAVHLARAAQIVRRHLFDKAEPFDGSLSSTCQEDSVPSSLVALVNMILEGPSIKDQVYQPSNPAALSLAQLLKFNAVKYARKHKDTPTDLRHSLEKETPLAIYVGLKLHAETRKRELVEKLAQLGISITYDRVLQISADMGNSVCELYRLEQVVCPPMLKLNLFTTSAVDNIDVNKSSTTAKDSFHGTAISLFQHPRQPDDGTDRGRIILGGAAGMKKLGALPNYYTNVPPVQASVKGSPVPDIGLTSMAREETPSDDRWLEHVREHIENKTTATRTDNISWAAYHAHNLSQSARPMSITALLPLFHESAHTVAMIKHSMDVIVSAVQHINPGQTPVIACDQPLFAIAKEIQWKWPEIYGEDKFVILFGGLHIELAALKTAGDWLAGSGWVEALVQADIASAGTADSFLRAAHVARTRHAHQVTSASLDILQHRAYDAYARAADNDQELSFQEWCQRQTKERPQFQYWSLALALEVCILTFVRSLREADFDMYLDALWELLPWFFALDHTHYARWISVHLRDMLALHRLNPEVLEEFRAGMFTVQKTRRTFSCIATDHAHEQNNARIKGDGGAVGLMENPNALQRWMVAGPEVARVISEFEVAQEHNDNKAQTLHHDQTETIQKAFDKDVRSLVSAFEELGNPFLEETTDIVVLDTKEIASASVAHSVHNVQKVGKEALESFVQERLIERKKPLSDVLSRNKLPLFGSLSAKAQPKDKQKVASLKSDVHLFSRLYIACQTREGNLDDFFSHENQPFPPSLSEAGKLRSGTKSDLLQCFEDIAPARTQAPEVTCIILDGAVIAQMLRPGTANTFGEYAKEVFIPFVLSHYKYATRMDLVWDRYLPNSLKSMTREKRGKGVRRRVGTSVAVPGQWQNFLRVDENKTELFNYLSKEIIKSAEVQCKELVVTLETEVLTTPPRTDLESLAPCSQEEADGRMLLHAADAARRGHDKILIRTVDTDVVVLAVTAAQSLTLKIWLAFGTGKSLRYIPAHDIATALGPAKSMALPMFHALTGCDTVSAFAGRGKRTAWAVWESFPELTNALSAVNHEQLDVTESCMSIIERFVILMYDRTSTCSDINTARKKLFAKKGRPLESIPPTHHALVQHVRRAVYQGAVCWGQALSAQPDLPCPSEWGWKKTADGQIKPSWTTLPEASKICNELIRCGCTKLCTTARCTCKKSALQCTSLCSCDGECNRD